MKAAVLCLLLLGCQGPLVKVSEPHSVLVTWEREHSGNCGGYPAPVVSGCAYPDGEKCRIVMPEGAADATVAEEFRHCFGYRHR